MESKSQKISYEQASKELEQIVQKLEDGTLALEESVKLFERGQELIKICYSHLDAAKGKLTVIKETLGTLTEED